MIEVDFTALDMEMRVAVQIQTVHALCGLSLPAADFLVDAGDVDAPAEATCSHDSAHGVGTVYVAGEDLCPWCARDTIKALAAPHIMLDVEVRR